MLIRKFAVALAAAGLTVGLTGSAFAQESLTDQVNSLRVAAEQGGYPGQDALDINYDREELLARNSAAFPKCDGYFSRYDAECYTSADEVDGDHLVAIAEAWRSGGAGWSDSRWEQFDGDLANMAVMTDDLNQHEKSDKDVTGWVPSHDVCQFVGVVVDVKTKYDLAVDSAEKDALLELAGKCDGTGNDDGGKDQPKDQPKDNGKGKDDGKDKPSEAPDPEPVENDLAVTG